MCGETDPEPHLPREGEQHAAARHAHRHQVSCYWSVVTPCSPLIGQAAGEEAAVPVAAVPRVPAADQADLHDRGDGDERAAGAVSAALHARLLQPREEDRDRPPAHLGLPVQAGQRPLADLQLSILRHEAQESV